MSPRLSVISIVVLLVVPALVRCDAYDHYTNPILAKIPGSKSAEKVTKLTAQMMQEHSRALPGASSAFIVVKTNDNRYAKLHVRGGAQKVPGSDPAPIAVVERYTTYREGEERTIHTVGQNLHLFADFRLNLDLGQLVPSTIPADLRFVVTKDEAYLEPVGKAELYLVTAHLPEANPPKTDKLVVGAKFEMRYFNGDYKLYDDGRRSGTLHLKVADTGDVVGHYFSDKDGQKYEVSGKVSNAPLHKIEFLISYPRTTQTFIGYLFTGDGKALTGSSVLQGHATGFYAVRIEDGKK